MAAGARVLAQRLLAQQAVARMLASDLRPDEAAPALLAALGENLGWDLGVLWEADADASPLSCRALWHAEHLHAEPFRRSCLELSLRPAADLPVRVWRSGAPEWVPDILADDTYVRREAAAQVGLRALLAVPITCRGRRSGVIELYACSPRRPDPGLMDLVSSIGSQFGQYIEHRRAVEAVHRSEARKRAILDAALDPVITMDARGRVVEFNPAAERTFGYRRDEVLGRELAELIIPPAQRAHHRAGLARYLATGESRATGRRLRMFGMRADGTEFAAEVSVSRVDAPEVLFTGHVRDISGLQAAEVERDRRLAGERAARAEAQAAEERARRLMADAAAAGERERRRVSEELHDGALQNLLVARQELQEAMRGDPEALRYAEEALNATIAQLREAVLELHPVALEHLGLGAVLAAMVGRLARRGGVLASVGVDPEAAGFHDQLVISLAREWVTNVVKHAAATTVEVAVTRSASSLILEVADDGRGIAPGRLEQALREGHIGLASSAERLAALGGALEVLPNAGGGARVRGALPLGGGA